MIEQSHSKLVSFIWSIADDCLRDVYVRGKYRDVILPMVVLRRLDTLLEPTKAAVLEEVRFQREDMKATELDEAPLRAASGYVFYNTSQRTLKQIHATATNNQQILLANVEDYLGGFSDNVKEIIARFKLLEQMRHMADKQVLLDVLEKFISPYINLTPHPVEDPDGNTLLGLSNLGMGYVFEELIRKFNEENNEEAGEHFTPREVIHLMTHLVFDPVKDRLPPVMTIYDPACGSGGMLTESQNYVLDPEGQIKATGDVYLYGKEINDETYAICKSDMMIKGNNPENIKVGSTLSTDEFASHRFDFMLSNPPYGKSWNSELKYIKDGKDVIDPRFKVELADYWGKAEPEDATPRSSDGQLLFLMEMVSKMKSTKDSAIGSRIASVHNGSSLFTGDAGSGESNIRRFIIENDMLDTIIQLPNNLFYNTGITTYIWLLTNAKPAARRGQVQLIDANLLFRKLRKNLGDKNCEFAPEHIDQIISAYAAFKPIERELDPNGDPAGIAVKLFDNTDFGYHKVTIESPDRRRAQFSVERLEPLRFDRALREPMEHLWAEHGDKVYQPDFLKLQAKAIQAWCEEREVVLNAKQRAKLIDTSIWLGQRDLMQIGHQLMQAVGTEETSDFNAFRDAVGKVIKNNKIKLTATEKNAILNAVSWYADDAEKVIESVQRLTAAELNAVAARLNCEIDELGDFGLYRQSDGSYLTYEPSADLRDSEAVPLKDSIHRYFKAEVKPYAPEAWINLDTVKIGYEISFNKYFYRHTPLRSVEAVTQDILALEQKADDLVADILQRQASIQQVLTRGLDPEVQLKDSGVDWIGGIPAHWEVRRSKYVFAQRKELARDRDVQLSATQSYGVIPQEEFEEKVGRRVVKIQTNLEKRKHVEIDDFVISMRSFQGGLERAFATGCIRSSYVILRPIEPVNADFFGFLFKSPRYIKALQTTGNFIRDGQDLNFENFSKVDLFIPPLDEQASIAAHIKAACKKIDYAIAMKDEQIAALKEYKTSLINAAVTGKIKVT